jgi:hypothetical protein
MTVTETMKSSFRIPNPYREIQTLHILGGGEVKNVQYSMHSDKEGYEFQDCTTQQHEEKLICVYS